MCVCVHTCTCVYIFYDIQGTFREIFKPLRDTFQGEENKGINDGNENFMCQLWIIFFSDKVRKGITADYSITVVLYEKSNIFITIGNTFVYKISHSNKNKSNHVVLGNRAATMKSIISLYLKFKIRILYKNVRSV